MVRKKLSIAERIHQTPQSATVRIADLAAELRRQGKQVLDFSAGRAAEGSPESVNQTAARALLGGDTHQTPARGKPEYRQAVAHKLAQENNLVVDPEKNVLATLGCKNGLMLALMAMMNPGDEVIVEDPCFVSYIATIGLLGGTARPVPLSEENNFRWRKEDLENAVTEHTRAILYCSPHNPTGTVHTIKDLQVIAEVARKHNLYVIADEIYERIT